MFRIGVANSRNMWCLQGNNVKCGVERLTIWDGSLILDFKQLRYQYCSTKAQFIIYLAWIAWCWPWHATRTRQRTFLLFERRCHHFNLGHGRELFPRSTNKQIHSGIVKYITPRLLWIISEGFTKRGKSWIKWFWHDDVQQKYQGHRNHHSFCCFWE